MFPLDETRKSDPENGGYTYLQWSDYQRGWHEGVDYNAGAGAFADEGMTLRAIAKQTCVWTGESATGFGKHQWWRIDDGPAWLIGAHIHYAHAQGFDRAVGDTVDRGMAIGRCGHTGTVHPHLHFVVSRAEPSGWNWYGSPQLSRETVASLTWDPTNVCTALEAWQEEHHVSPEEQAVIDAIRESNYPISEVPELIRSVATWSANSASLSAWVSEIGALKARVAELEAAAAPAEAPSGDA